MYCTLLQATRKILARRVLVIEAVACKFSMHLQDTHVSVPEPTTTVKDVNIVSLSS